MNVNCEDCQAIVQVTSCRATKLCSACKASRIKFRRIVKYASAEDRRIGRNKFVKKYKKKNAERIKKYFSEWHKSRKESDLSFKLYLSLRSRLHSAYVHQGLSSKGLCSRQRIIRLLGCSLEEWISYLESKFREDMSWANYGFHGWHIDHVRPFAAFDLTKELDAQKVMHYTNTQPLWRDENLRKGRKTS